MENKITVREQDSTYLSMLLGKDIKGGGLYLQRFHLKSWWNRLII